MAATETDLPALGAHARGEAGHELQETLVDLIALMLIGKQLHWNIEGPGFREFHLHLDELVEEWRDLADTVAERAVALGVSPDGRAPTVVEQSHVDPVEPGSMQVPTAIRELAARVATADEEARASMDRLGQIDLTSQDVLIEVTRTLEKQLWMIRAQL